jgi:HAE1 family hydrophobic/amphiphilic exporter-1
MSLSELCIRRPVMTTLLMVSFLVFGMFGYRQLPVAALPRVDFPTIAVSATAAGRQPGDDGGLRRRAAGARVRDHSRRSRR